jgi:hypothetical protein
MDHGRTLRLCQLKRNFAHAKRQDPNAGVRREEANISESLNSGEFSYHKTTFEPASFEQEVTKGMEMPF